MVTSANELLLHILASIAPPVCLGCSRADGLRSLPLCLCRLCRERLRRVEDPPPGTVLGSVLEAHWAGWVYQEPLDRVIHALKFGQLDFLGAQLAEALYSMHREVLSRCDLIVPIPLHWTRSLRRGYNQAERIAAPLARLLQRPLVPALSRFRRTPAQARLGREQRLGNLANAFRPVSRHRHRISARRLLLVDDVFTTGATLEAAARCLLAAGGASVSAVTAAQAPIGRNHARDHGIH